jgi:hypothetical protein
VIKQKQLFRHRPAEGIIGDCHRTAIACLLDLAVEAVPHFGAVHWESPADFSGAFERWLQEQGFRTVVIVYDCPLEQVLACIGSQNKGAYYILGGMSRTGVNHSVLGCGGEIAWDPSLDDAGIVGPCDDGFYWVTFLVPSSMYAKHDAVAEAA